MDWQAIFRSNKFTNSIVLCALCFGCVASERACMDVCACVHYRENKWLFRFSVTRPMYHRAKRIKIPKDTLDFLKIVSSPLLT